MAVKRVFNGATIIKPGAYTRTVVQNLTGFPLSATGTIGIIGEANGGEPQVIDILTREAIQDAKTRYKQGNIADALGLLASPSNDPRIANGASTIIVYKTNAGTQSTVTIVNPVPANIITLTSKNWGVDENNINYAVSEGTVVDADAEIEGTVAGDYSLSGTNEDLILDINGTTHTFDNTLSGTVTSANLIVEMNDDTKWSPGNAPVTAAANTVGTGIKITIDTAEISDSELDYGYISVDAASTIDLIVGITGEVRGNKGSRIFTIVKGTLSEVSSEIGGVDQLEIEYTGAADSCVISIQDAGGERKLTTTTASSNIPSDDLDILLENTVGANQLTIQELADQINAHVSYTATAVAPNPDRAANELDYYLDVEIPDVPLGFKADIFDTKFELDTFGTLVNVTIISNAIRAYIINSTPAFLTGGVNGVSANSDFTTGLAAFEDERINTVIPLISADAGSLTVDSINAAVRTHVISMNSTIGRSERNAYCSLNDTKSALRTAARTLNSQYVSMSGQQVRVVDAQSNLSWLDPWAFNCICAGMQAGSEVGEPITFKVINVNNIRVEDGSWTPKQDFATLIEDGVLIGEPLDAGGFRVVLGNTSYVTDANFVFNRISVVEAVGYISYDLRLNLESVFTGTKARTGTAETIANFIKARMSIYLKADITVGDDLNSGLGYKDLSVTLTGNTATITMSVTPVQGIDFLLPTIYLADIQQSAS